MISSRRRPRGRLPGGPPTNTVLPSISGPPQQGSTLTCSTGTWTGSPTSYAYQWKSAGSNVGTNQNTYVPVSGDVGNTVTLVVTATNAGGSASATSAGVTILWTPASLTGLAACVLPALSRSQGKLWQDTGKTVAATAASDPVRVATCPFTGVDFTAPSDAARPVLGTDGAGKWWLVYNGVSSVLSAADTPALDLTTMTVGVTVYRTTTTGTYRPIVSKSLSANTSQGYWLVDWNNTVRCVCGNGATLGDFRSGYTVPLNGWTNVEVTYDNANIALLVNGVSNSSLAYVGGMTTPTTQPLKIGSDDAPNGFFGGDIGGVAIYGRALSGAEITLLDTYLAGLHP